MNLRNAHYYIDRQYIRFNANQLFKAGWGSQKLIESITTDLNLKKITTQNLIQIKLGNPTYYQNYKLIEGFFISNALGLINTQKKADFMICMPKNMTSIKKQKICVSLAGSGDTDYEFRLKKIAIPLSKHGVATLIHTNSFYGSRKPKIQTKHYINSVSDFLIMFNSIVYEANEIIKLLIQQYDCKVVLTGSSMGGQATSIVASKNQDNRNIGFVPYIAPASVAYEYSYGSMSKSIDWTVLNQNNNLDNTKSKLFELLSYGDIKRFEKPQCPFVHIINAKYDGYISNSNSLQYEKFWNIPIHWINKGHITALLFNKMLIKGILTVFNQI